MAEWRAPLSLPMECTLRAVSLYPRDRNEINADLEAHQILVGIARALDELIDKGLVGVVPGEGGLFTITASGVEALEHEEERRLSITRWSRASTAE